MIEGLVGLVLVGGASRRMGVDKALLEFEGSPLGRRSVDALTAAGITEVWVVGGTDAHSRALGANQLPDEDPGSGPLPAIAGAWRRLGDVDLLVLPCDLARIGPADVKRIIEAAEETTTDLMFATSGGRRQYPIGLWRHSARSSVIAAVDRGRRDFASAVRGLTLGTVEGGRTVADSDRPEELPSHRPDPVAVSVVGPSGSGKTTLIVALISELTGRGHQVHAIKHEAHRVELDTPGKDTWRFRQSGAASTILVGDDQVAWFAEHVPLPDLSSLLHFMAPGDAIVLVEGFRGAGLPCIVVGDPGDPSRWEPPQPEVRLTSIASLDDTAPDASWPSEIVGELADRLEQLVAQRPDHED